MRAVKVVGVIGPRRTKGGDFVVAVELSNGEEGGVILPREQLLEFLELLQAERDQSPQERMEIPPLRPTVQLDEDVPEMVPVARIELSEPVDPKNVRTPGICEVRFQDVNGVGATLLLDPIGVVHWRDLLNDQIARTQKGRN
ncbi:hypothetical protein [Hyphomicrobium sp.]|uniref:hypothetical protein n=1 Tax=Hyphomicrobium sp. TaxID=82 RepID=UPI001E03B177|nr:hypothetical protein [Hyphomicrobium sp.]MBY0559843.1 hypothetical protein [Hyphomicrobium sp.]